jgi:hypothetical protein
MEGSGEESEEEVVRASLAAADYGGRKGVGGGRAPGVEMAGGTFGAPAAAATCSTPRPDQSR